MKFGACIPNQILRPGTAHKSKRHTSNFANVFSKVINKASNFACKTELGRLPLNITINQKILKYIVYIKSSFVEQSFLKPFDLY